MRNKKRFLVALVCCLTMAGSVAAQDLWLHVRVDEEGGAKVSVNLPMNMIETALSMVPQDHLHHGRVVFDETDWTIADLRELWRSVTESPDMTFVTVEDGDENVRVWKEGGFLKVRVEEGEGETESHVDVRVPASVVDALLSGDGEEFNFRAALEALAEYGEGELVTVNDDNERVRVWVDGVAEPVS